MKGGGEGGVGRKRGGEEWEGGGRKEKVGRMAFPLQAGSLDLIEA
jgi:hypothetical protein